MQLVRRMNNDLADWSPLDRFISLRDEFNRLMELPFGDMARSSEFFQGWIPRLDVFEDKDNLVVKMEVPGMKKEELEISLHDSVLTIAGERKAKEPTPDTQVHRSERFLGRFHRSISVSKPIAIDKIKATYQDGILTVTLPKTEEAKPRQIEVSVG